MHFRFYEKQDKGRKVGNNDDDNNKNRIIEWK